MIFAAVSRISQATTLRATALVVLAVAGCTSGGTTEPDPEIDLLVVGMVRNHITTKQETRLEGAVVFFYDRNSEQLLEGEAFIIAGERPGCDACPMSWELDDFLPVGAIEGAIYHKAPQIRPGDRWKLVATAFGPDTIVQVESTEELVPQEFEIRIAAEHSRDEPLVVDWDPVPDAEKFTVAAGSGYEIELPGGTTSYTIPASAFSGVSTGVEVEITVTAFNNFYVSIATGISSLDDAEEIAERFLQTDNVEGANGTFGAATSVSRFVTIQ